jgi:hypothetical protein
VATAVTAAIYFLVAVRLGSPVLPAMAATAAAAASESESESEFRSSVAA